MRKLIGLLLITIFCTFFANGSDGKPHRVVKRLPAATKTEASKPAKSSDTAEEPFSKPTPILDSTDGNSSGVNITTAAWDSAIHVDPTYYAFAQVHKEQFNKYDFYYRLEIVPQFRPSFEACKSQNDFLSFFEKLFKTEDGALVSVTANIQHRWSSGSATNIFNGDAALVLAAKGASIKGNPGTGCFFDFTARPSFPWITWNGGRAGRDMYDDFQIKFSVAGAKAKSYGAVNAVVSLFSGFSAAARWYSVANPLASPVATGAQAVGNSFQDAIQNAGTFQNQVTKIQFLNAYFANEDRQHGRILIQIPDLFGKDPSNSKEPGNLAIYVRRQASFALQGSGQVTPQTVFDTAELVYRQCSLTKIVSGSCDAKENATIRTTMATALKAIDSKLDGNNPSASLFDLRDPATIPKGPKAKPASPQAPQPTNASASPSDGQNSNDKDKSGQKDKKASKADQTPQPGNASPAPPSAPPKGQNNVKNAQQAADGNVDEDIDRRTLIYDVCKGMREVSLLQFHLSTLDEIAVRWAFTMEGGIQQALAGAKKDALADANNHNTELQDKFKKTYGHSWQEIEEQCWNDGDAYLLAGTAKGLGRTVEGTPEVEDIQLRDLSLVSEAEKKGAIENAGKKSAIENKEVAPSTSEESYLFDQAERDKFGKGTFGLDLSHYEIDVENKSAKCGDRQVYNSSPECSCKVDWLRLAQQGLRYVYYEHTIGSKPADFSAAKVWAELESFHQSKKLFRGAYHFLMPNPLGVPAGDASVQANNFLKSIGAVDGHQPAQLAPVLDMEGTHTSVKPDDEQFKQCPAGFLRKDSSNPPRYSCDMWYKVAPQDIAALATDWIARVEKATGKKVTIYTNKDDWWDPVMGQAPTGEKLLKEKPIWIARYTKNGPEHNPAWGGSGVKWGMPPLPADATYPSDSYNHPNFWQFTESGVIRFDDGSQGNAIVCNGTPSKKKIDFSYAPVTGDEFDKLFVLPSPVASASNVPASKR